MRMLLREIESAARDRSLARTCATKGCHKTPAGGKPYCAECVGEMPYAAELAAEHVQREADLRLAARGCVDKINVHGSRCREILGLLILGERTVGSLCHEIDVTGGRYGASSLSLVKAFVEAMRRAGLVVTRELRDRQGRVRDTVRLA